MAAELAFHGLQIIAGIVCVLAVRWAWGLHQRSRFKNAELNHFRPYLEDILNHLRDGVLIVNSDLEVLFSNDTASVLVKECGGKRVLDPEQGGYKPILENGQPMQPEDWPIRRAFKGHFEKDFIVFLRNERTSEIILREITNAPFRVPHSSKPHVMVTFRDVTATRSLEEARNRLSSIVESSDDAIIGKDSRGTITSWNLGAERIFGYTAREMVGQSIMRLIPPEAFDEEAMILSRILNNQRIAHFQTTRITKDGRSIPVSLTISPILDTAGRVIGASKIARHLSGIRSLEAQLQRSQKMEALGQLTGGIAHDFNNLLGIILGNLELLQSEITVEVLDREQGRRKIARTLQHAKTACNAATSAADLTRRLLAFSSSGQLKPSSTCLHTAISNTLSLASRVLGPNIQIETDLDTSSPMAFVDPAAFESALLNLIVNARDAMPSGGSLRITTSIVNESHLANGVVPFTAQETPYACITVVDSGTGMSQDTLEHAFEPFFTTKAQGQGTGLGLAMVYGFLRQSNGTARIESEFGQGTAVSLYLPLLTEKPGQPLTLTTSPDFAQQQATILLVDDQPELLQVGVIYLTSLGYEVLTAEGPVAALTLLEQTPNIDLLLTDILMPGDIDGVALAETVRSRRPDIGIIFSSGFNSTGATQDRLLAVSDAHLYKPYKLQELGALVDQVLTQRQSRLNHAPSDLPEPSVMAT